MSLEQNARIFNGGAAQLFAELDVGGARGGVNVVESAALPEDGAGSMDARGLGFFEDAEKDTEAHEALERAYCLRVVRGVVSALRGLGPGRAHALTGATMRPMDAWRLRMGFAGG